MLKFVFQIFVPARWLSGIMVLLLSSSCVNTEAPLLKVATNFWAGYETLYLAREQNFFDEHEIRLIEMNSASEVMNAFRDERIEVAALTLDEALTLKAEGHDLKVFLVMDVSNGADTLMVRPFIQSFDDLKGRRIALEQTAVGALMLEGVLSKSHLKLADIQVVNITADGHYHAFVNGEVDAVITFEPQTTKLMREGAVKLFDSADIPGRIVDVLVVRTAALQTHQESIRKLVDAQFNALAILHDKPRYATGLMAPRLDISASEMLLAFDGLELPDRQMNAAMLSGDAPSLQQTINELKGIMLSTGMVSQPFDSDQILIDRFILEHR
jgi:NitT/TauT family transport system substrate-binding protein